jgi:8-oxo-dGTP pyrophosphatase MutT (NUDIX family)
MKNGRFNQDMFNHMTIEEKLAISTLDFDTCERIYAANVNTSSTGYIRRKCMFTRSVLSDNGKRILDYINKSTNHPAHIWEIPKGRPKTKINETDLECAYREFTEETGIPKSHIRVIDRKKYIYTFTEDGVRYEYIYYLAVYVGQRLLTGVPFARTTQLAEVIDVQWMDARQLENMSNPSINCNKEIGSFAKKIISIVKRFIKQSYRQPIPMSINV